MVTSFKTTMWYLNWDIDINSQIEHFYHHRIPMVFFYTHTHFPPTPDSFLTTLTNTNLFSIPITLSFQGCYGNGIIQYITFWDCLVFFFFPLIIILWRIIQVVVYYSLFLFIGIYNSVVEIYRALIIHPLKEFQVVSSLELLWIKLL